MSTPEEQHQMAAAIQQLSARLQMQESVLTMLQSERESFVQQSQNLTATASTQSSRVGVGEVNTRVIGKPNQFDGDTMKCADWSFKLRSYLGAVDQRWQKELTETEASMTPGLNATLDSDGSVLSTQLYYMFVMTTSGTALDKCHNASVKEGFDVYSSSWSGSPSFERSSLDSWSTCCRTGSKTTFRPS